MADERAVEAIKSTIIQMMDEQRGAQPDWWEGGNIRGVDVKAPVKPEFLEAALLKLAEHLVDSELVPVTVQHGLRNDIWSLNVKVADG